MGDVVISIVSYCQKDLLDRCLIQLKTLDLPTSWQLIVVDNNSSDGSADMVRCRHSWAKLICLKKNLGFSGGHNTSYAQTQSEIFIVLNPDVIVLPGSLETLLEAFEKFPEAAIVGPCLLNKDGTLQFSARRFYNWRTIICRRLAVPGRRKVIDYHLMKDKDLNQILSVDWLLGAAMAIRRSAFNEKEIFDTRYKLYFEDVDLCYFAKKAGWKIVYCPTAKMIHDHQRASAKNILSSAVANHFLSWIKFYLKTKYYFKTKIPAVKQFRTIGEPK